MSHSRQLFWVALVSSLSVFGGSMIAPVEARFIESITNNSFLTGTVFAVGSVFFAFLSYWLGRLSDRYGRKKLILVSLVAGFVYALLFASVVNIFQFYGVKFAWAIAAVGTGPLLRAHLQTLMSTVPNKGRIYGYIYSAQSVVGSVGALTGGFLANFFGLTAPFYALAILSIVMILLVSFLIYEQKTEAVTKLEGRSFFKTLQYVLSTPPLLFYLVFNTSFSINWGIKNFLWPLIIFSLAGDDFITGSIYATMGIIAFILLPFAGNWVDRYGTYRITFLQFFCLGTAGVSMALTDSLTVFWLLVAIYTVGEVLNLTQIVLITETVPNEIRGEILGLDSAMDQMLMILSPVLAGLSVTLIGLSFTLLVFMSLYWLSLLFGVIIYRRLIVTA